MKTQALKKLASECKNGKFGHYANIMKQSVRDALEIFIRQDEEFAQAVAQGGNFTDCMKEVEKGVVKGAISDLDAYKRAVQFYFPGADVEFQMKIRVNPHESGVDDKPDAAASTGAITLNFTELFGG